MCRTIKPLLDRDCFQSNPDLETIVPVPGRDCFCSSLRHVEPLNPSLQRLLSKQSQQVKPWITTIEPYPLILITWQQLLVNLVRTIGSFGVPGKTHLLREEVSGSPDRYANSE